MVERPKSPDSEVEKITERLYKRDVKTPDRQILRDALDHADAPLRGREGQDAAIGNLSRR